MAQHSFTNDCTSNDGYLGRRMQSYQMCINKKHFEHDKLHKLCKIPAYMFNDSSKDLCRLLQLKITYTYCLLLYVVEIKNDAACDAYN